MQQGIGHITKGNVLDDLGLDEQTALELKMKAEIHEGLLVLIEKRGYSSRDLERLFDLPQPRISELMTGKLSKMSIGRLLWYLAKVGEFAIVKFVPSARASKAARS